MANGAWKIERGRFSPISFLLAILKILTLPVTLPFIVVHGILSILPKRNSYLAEYEGNFIPKLDIGLFATINYILGALSFFKLAEQAFDTRLSPTLRGLTVYYERAIHALLDWQIPYLNRLLHILNTYINLHLRLDQQWRHIFILTMLYFGAAARVRYKTRGVAAAIVTFAVGTFFSVINASVSGEISSAPGVFDVIAASSIPTLGILSSLLLSELLLSAYDRNEVDIFGIVAVGLIFIFISLLTLGLTTGIYWLIDPTFIRDTSLAKMLIFLVVFAGAWLLLGWAEAIDVASRDPDVRTWRDVYGKVPSAAVGIGMLRGIVGGIVFLVLNASLNAMHI
jgi:hypothetical protein